MAAATTPSEASVPFITPLLAKMPSQAYLRTTRPVIGAITSIISRRCTPGVRRPRELECQRVAQQERQRRRQQAQADRRSQQRPIIKVAGHAGELPRGERDVRRD